MNAIGDALFASPGSSTLLDAIQPFAPPQLVAVQDTGRTTTLIAVEQGADLRALNLANGQGEFVVTGFAGMDAGATRITVEQFQQALRSGAFVDELNRLRRQLREEFNLDRSTSITVAGLSLGVSVVYILWLIRGGVLLGSYLSALPAWRLLDPLPVLARTGDDEEEDEDEPLSASRPVPADPLRGFA